MIFYIESLLSKWGFSDGALVLDFIDNNYDNDEGWQILHNIDIRDSLANAIRKFVEPKIENDIKLIKIETSHNPIRIDTADGIEVDWSGDNSHIKISPETVEISDKEFYQFLKEEAGL